ncbi:IclR family transcriptional regulator domain-containing protein [Tepidicella baoligensis]|uniref:IclR family transcriptional regulator domain-containing protein n=1 Tax=Tepidicella baoligensis TaxID=2707016 RepID=UPI0015DADC9D|nr:IclR family transcriptional regulator C-terminal domain-containing protein [Tepidicella baoligensis]
MSAQNFVIAKADFIESMAKGMAVLESFDTERQRLNATLAAQRAGITRAAARRHLLTLAHLGYLETDGSYFWLSSKVLRFSGSYLASARLPRTVQPVLNRLAAYTGDSFSVAVLEGDSVVIVARSVLAAKDGSRNDWLESSLGNPLRPSQDVRWTAHGLHLGARLPAHATSTGRVLLASLPTAELTAWLKGRLLSRLTPYTVIEHKGLRRILSQVRRQDWCLASEEHELGVHAVAVPLRNMAGRTVAALNAVVSTARLQSGAVQAELLPLLQNAALECRPAL